MPNNPKTNKATSKRKLNFDDVDEQSNVRNQDGKGRSSGKKRSTATQSKNPSNQRMDSFLSPQKKVTTESKLVHAVTPNEPEPGLAPKVTPAKGSDNDYIPSYIHKNVEYIRKGHMSKLTPHQSKILQWITEHYEIPNDFEQNRKYGPLSGTTYLERVIAAYRLGSLPRTTCNNDEDTTDVICTICANTGHTADACPTII
jgi:hypothetical protein